MATNDYAESSFAGVASHIQNVSRIKLSSAVAVSDMQRNTFFHRTGGDNVGLFHDFPEGTHMALVNVAMEDTPRTSETNNVLLNRQREAKRLKVEIAKEKVLQKATENNIEAVYYNRMYRSDACWKTVCEVSNGVKILKTKNDKYEALKENIKIWVIGFGWDQFHQAWSKDGNPYSIEFLADKLKDIIRTSKKWKYQRKYQLIFEEDRVCQILEREWLM